MSRDLLLFGQTQTEHFAELYQWYESSLLHPIVVDYHRLQLEHWIWSKRHLLHGAIVDVGVITPRRWLGAGYRTLGLAEGDVVGDLRAMPFETASIDSFLLTEVLEHCEDPFAAMREVHRVMKPGGLLLVTSPFLWPWHGTADYKDYWRFTHEGWALLLKAFSHVTIAPCTLTDEGQSLYDLMRRFECWGFSTEVRGTTGYLCEAIR